jgi:uncharacterized protein YbjT (DUF2867 family)
MTTIVIAGGHGKIALLLAQALTSRGDTVRSLIRNPDHADDVRATGAEPVVFDLEAGGDLAAELAGADAVVFAAGAGPDSGAERKWTVDRDGALALAAAAKSAGVLRYLLVSSYGARPDARTGDDVFDVYLAAKHDADVGVLASGLDVTVLRPVSLTDAPGTGRVELAAHVDRGSVPRADVAAVLVALLDTPASIGATVELVSGDTEIGEAVGAL